MWPSVWKMDKRFKIIPVKVTRCFPSGGEPVSRSGMWECGQVWCKHHHIPITCWHRGQSWSLPLRSKLRSPLQGRTFPQRAARKTAHSGSNNHEQASCALACPKSQRRLRAPSASSIACRRRCWCHFNRCDLFIQYNTFSFSNLTRWNALPLNQNRISIWKEERKPTVILNTFAVCPGCTLGNCSVYFRMCKNNV